MSGFWIAFAGLAFSIAMAACAFAFKLGGHSQRMAQGEIRLDKLEAKEANAVQSHVDVALLSQAMLGMKESMGGMEKAFTTRIDQLEHDLRGLLSGRIKPAIREKAD